MNTIGALLARYALEHLAQAFEAQNCPSTGSQRTAPSKNSENEAFKIELSKHGNKCLVEASTYRPAVRAMKGQANAAHKSPAEINAAPQSQPSSQSAQQAEQLDFQEFEQANFKAFKAAWGSKAGEANFNATYDFDNNGVIDMLDYLGLGKALQASFQEFKQAWGSVATEATYDNRYDYNKDGVIDMLDWLTFGKNWVA